MLSAFGNDAVLLGRSGTVTSLQETERQEMSFTGQGNFLSNVFNNSISGGLPGAAPKSSKQPGGSKLAGAKLQRADRVKNYVETNNVEGFKFLMLSRKEYLNMRFQQNMNLLQLVCFEEASLILEFIRKQFENDEEAKRQMAQHRDKHMGSQAIHLAAATGNRWIIEVLMLDFEGDPYEKTLGN